MAFKKYFALFLIFIICPFSYVKGGETSPNSIVSSIEEAKNLKLKIIVYNAAANNKEEELQAVLQIECKDDAVTLLTNSGLVVVPYSSILHLKWEGKFIINYKEQKIDDIEKLSKEGKLSKEDVEFIQKNYYSLIGLKKESLCIYIR